VTIPDAIAPLLRTWREMHSSADEDALIFPSEKGTPIRPENWLRRSMKPIADGLGITVPVNFQTFRRTFATNAQGLGNPKDVQAHLRHSDISTTLNEYTQTIPGRVRKLVNAVANEVMEAGPRLSPSLVERAQAPRVLNTIEHKSDVPESVSCWINGAGDGDRTRDIQLGNLAV
jgi:Phage integrase family